MTSLEGRGPAPGARAARDRGRGEAPPLDLSSGYYWSAEGGNADVGPLPSGQGMPPERWAADRWERHYACKLVLFPNGSRDIRVRAVDRYRELPGEAAIRDKRRASGFRFVPSKEEVERRAAENRERAARHARQFLRYRCVSIGADHLVTLTYRENVTDYKRARADFNAFAKLVRARYPEWFYVMVPEVQERGAWHFHVAVKGFQNVNYLRACWYRVVGEGMGNIDVQGPSARWAKQGGAKTWRQRSLVNYLCKYLGKNFETMAKGSRRFEASRDAPRPQISRFWMQGVTSEGELFERVYSIVAQGRAVGVRQWLSADGSCYWVHSPGPPCEPF